MEFTENFNNLGNPWFTIWTDTRSTIRHLIKSDPERNVILLAILGTFNQSIGNIEADSIGSALGWMLFSIIASGIGGIIGLYLVSAILGFVASLFGYSAPSEYVRTAYAWSNVPGAVILPFTILLVLLNSAIPLGNTSLSVVLNLIYLVVAVIFGIWSVVILTKGLGEVWETNALNAFGILMIPGVAVIVLIFSCIFTFSAFNV